MKSYLDSPWPAFGRLVMIGVSAAVGWCVTVLVIRAVIYLAAALVRWLA